LSPVVATTLLVAVAVILAVIIFFWARGFIGDSVNKFGVGIEQACPDVAFSAEAINGGKLYVQNEGSVPIYAMEVKLKKLVGVESLGVLKLNVESLGITAGESGSKELSDLEETLNVGDEIIVVPLLLGETDNERKAQACDEEFGQEILVEA